MTLDHETRAKLTGLGDAPSWIVVVRDVEVATLLPLCLGIRLSIECVLDSLPATVCARVTGGRARFVVAISTVFSLHTAVSSVRGRSTWAVCLAVLEPACGVLPWRVIRR